MVSATTLSAVAQPALEVGALKTSFEALYNEHKRKVYSLCLRMLGNPTDAEDLTQEVFLQVYRKLGSFRGESSFSTWLHRLTVNTVLMHFRRQRARKEETIEEMELHRMFQPEPSANAQRDRTMIDRIALEDAIAQLPSGYRRVLLMHDIEGYEHEEIGRRLGITGGTTKSQLHKARAKLRRILRKPPRPGTQARLTHRHGRKPQPSSESVTPGSLTLLPTVAA